MFFSFTIRCSNTTRSGKYYFFVIHPVFVRNEIERITKNKLTKVIVFHYQIPEEQSLVLKVFIKLNFSDIFVV